MNTTNKACSIYKSRTDIFIISMWTLDMGVDMMGEVVAKMKMPVDFTVFTGALTDGLAAHRTNVPIPAGAKTHADKIAVSLGFRGYSQMCKAVELYLLESNESGFTLTSHIRADGGFDAESTKKGLAITKDLVSAVIE